MKFSYRLNKICGQIYSNGNLLFTSDGNAVISAIGNHINIYDLVKQNVITLPFENNHDIDCLAISHNGKFLISVDVHGHALFINITRQVILHRFHFKHRVYSLKFSPNDEMFALTHNNGCQIWYTPSTRREFCPFRLNRNLSGGYHDETTSLDWSSDSRSLIIGSKDLSTRVFHKIRSRFMSTSILSGHRDIILGAFFSNTNQEAYTVARDGAVFTWSYDEVVVEEAAATVDSSSDGIEQEAKKMKKNTKHHHHRRLKNKNSHDDDEIHEERDDGNDNSDGDEEDDDDDDSSDDDEDVPDKTLTVGKIVEKKRRWALREREFLWDPQTIVSSVDFNKLTQLLVVGFSSGVFGLYEMPGCINLHRLSISTHTITSVSINSTGEWLAIGSSQLGQLLVWEWKSESYVLKQQGHLYGLNTIDYSSDGQFIATGGEDGKVKLWNTISGFCFITFSEHIAPVTGVKFVGKGLGKAIISASLDGTIRAHDLLRYRNFRTLTTPEPVQFTCLAVDSSGEVVCAGALDPFNIYVWALQTGAYY